MKAFCEECRDYVDYTCKESVKVKTIKGKEIEHKVKSAYCSECESEMFVSNLRDMNLVSLDLAYRISEDLITQNEILEILEKYNIGKRPLSSLLGWGATTLTRFVKGDIPTKTYSETLRTIMNSPEYLLEILNKNISKVTDTAYQKCMDAINHEIAKTNLCSANRKIESVANYIISKSVEITPLALQKLLYFSQSFYRVFMGKFLFGEDCEAWVYGPVYRDIYFKYKDHGYNPIDENLEKFNCFDLTENELEVIDEVNSSFGCYSGKVLEKMTHIETPWKESRSGLEENEPSEKLIKKTLIEDYFSLVQKKYNMLSIPDIRDYSRDLFDKVNH